MYTGFYFGPTILLILPALILGIWAQRRVKKIYNKYLEIYSMRGLTGAQTAETILQQNDILDVKVERTTGRLSDHYDPKSKIIRISESNYSSSSISAIGIAAHEAGHALQHRDGYLPNKIRGFFVPIAKFGSMAAFPLFILGLWGSIPLLMDIAIWVFAGVVVFYMITLPVEYNASRRAVVILEEQNILYSDEIDGVKKVLNAAALTYVVSALSAIMNLLRLVLLRRRR